VHDAQQGDDGQSASPRESAPSARRPPSCSDVLLPSALHTPAACAPLDCGAPPPSPLACACRLTFLMSFSSCGACGPSRSMCFLVLLTSSTGLFLRCPKMNAMTAAENQTMMEWWGDECVGRRVWLGGKAEGGGNAAGGQTLGQQRDGGGRRGGGRGGGEGDRLRSQLSVCVNVQQCECAVVCVCEGERPTDRRTANISFLRPAVLLRQQQRQ